MLQHKYKVGNFDRKIWLLQKETENNQFNGETDTWEVYKEKWAMDSGKTGYEVIEADKTTAKRKTTLVIRYDSGVNEEMRLLMYDQVYDIVSVKQPQGIRKRFLELECEFLEGEEFEVALGGAFTNGFSLGFNS